LTIIISVRKPRSTPHRDYEVKIIAQGEGGGCVSEAFDLPNCRMNKYVAIKSKYARNNYKPQRTISMR
jgi:hypothetical protein